MKCRLCFVAALAIAWLVAGEGTARGACTITVTGVIFSPYNVFSAAPLDSTGTISFECSKQDKRIRITLTRGSSPTFYPRTMKNGTETLDYNLFINGYATVWGDGSEGTGFYYNPNPPNSKVVAVTVYARIRELQDVAHGAYTDTVVSQIEF